MLDKIYSQKVSPCFCAGFFAAPAGYQDIIKVKAPLKTRKGTEIAEIDMIDPLSLMEFLFCKCGLEIDAEHVRQYWNHYRSPETAADWAVWSDASNDHVPIGLYGDSCKIRAGEKMVGIFLNFPLFRPRSIRVSRFLLTCVQEELMVGRQTLDCLWRHVVWACNVLYNGKWPRTGPNGQLLPQHQAHKVGQDIVPNRKFCVTELRGDWLWFKLCFQFKSSWVGGTKVPVCFQCEARSVGDALYYDVTPESAVWETEYPDPVTFLVKQMPRNPSFLSDHYQYFS